MDSKRQARRRHSEELKALVLAACVEPGASVAAIAQTHGLNANLPHKWRRGHARSAQRSVTAGSAARAAAQQAGVFVPLALPAPPVTSPSDIRIELRRGSTSIAVNWPAAAAVECASWMRELLR